MIIALYLILGHLLSDFALQSNKLIKHKFRSPIGVLIHVAIHFVTMTFLLLPIILRGYYWILGVIFAICLIHFFLDILKVEFEKRDRKHSKLPSFLLDQMFHFLTIAGFYNVIYAQEIVLPVNTFNLLYTNQIMVLTLILGVLATFTYDITIFSAT